MTIEHLPALLVVLPMIAAFVCGILRTYTAAWLLAFVVCLALPPIAGVLLHHAIEQGPIDYAMGGWAPPIGIGYRVDVLSGFVLMIVAVMAPLFVLYAKDSLRAEADATQAPRIYALFLLCLTGLLGIAITNDAFNAFVFLEISSLSTYALVASGRDRRGLLAAYQYLVVGTIGATLYVTGVGLIYAMTGTLNLSDIAARLGPVEDTRPIIAGLVFITVGIGVKAALFPLHGWLPNAYAYAPSAITAFIAATATKVAVYLLIRFYYSVYGIDFAFGQIGLSDVLIALSVVGVVAASIVAVFQDDVKRLLAWSSVAQAGYMILGVGIANKVGLTGGIVHLLNHAVTKGALFFAVGAVVLRIGAARLGDLSGIGRKMPITMAAFTVAGLSLIGTPGTAGFISKWYLALGALEAEQIWLLFAIVGSSLIALLYVGRVLEVAYMRPTSALLAGVSDPPPTMLLPILVLTVACVWFGFDTQYSVGIASRAAELLLEAGP